MASDRFGEIPQGKGCFTEKWTIRVTDSGVVIEDPAGNCTRFTAGEALMVLDILKNEEAHLKDMAQKASPLPITLHV